jgi:uncharacterized protein YukE
MSVRSLGDWSPLDLDSDPIHADPEKIDEAQKRYHKISDTIKDAVATLEKVVQQGSDSLAGQYVETLQKDAGDVKDSLSKASTRYDDVADQIKIYQPHLNDGLRDTATALSDAHHAQDDQTKAKAMPDGQKDAHGTLSPDEQQKQDAKSKASAAADDKLSAAKSRLNNALDALNTAGKTLGDAVNCKNYDDGLSDSLKDKIDAVFEIIGKIFGIIGMILGVLAILIPGVDLLAIGALAAGAVSLISSSVLYANGDGSLLDVILGAVGVGLGGLGFAAGAIGKTMSGIAKGIWNTKPPGPNLTNIAGKVWGIKPGGMKPPGTAAIGPNDLMPAEFANLPDGFWNSQGAAFKGAWQMYAQVGNGEQGFLQFLKDFAGSVGGWKSASDLNAILKWANYKISPVWYLWGLGNGVFNAGNLLITGGELKSWFPAVNPPGYGS